MNFLKKRENHRFTEEEMINRGWSTSLQFFSYVESWWELFWPRYPLFHLPQEKKVVPLIAVGPRFWRGQGDFLSLTCKWSRQSWISRTAMLVLPATRRVSLSVVLIHTDDWLRGFRVSSVAPFISLHGPHECKPHDSRRNTQPEPEACACSSALKENFITEMTLLKLAREKYLAFNLWNEIIGSPRI